LVCVFLFIILESFSALVEKNSSPYSHKHKPNILSTIHPNTPITACRERTQYIFVTGLIGSIKSGVFWHYARRNNRTQVSMFLL